MITLMNIIYKFYFISFTHASAINTATSIANHINCDINRYNDHSLPFNNRCSSQNSSKFIIIFSDYIKVRKENEHHHHHLQLILFFFLSFISSHEANTEYTTSITPDLIPNHELGM